MGRKLAFGSSILSSIRTWQQGSLCGLCKLCLGTLLDSWQSITDLRPPVDHHDHDLPQRLHIYLLSAKILGQLCRKSAVQQIELARFQRGVHIWVHVKTSERCVYQEHMFVFVLRIKQDCRDTRLVLEEKVVAVGDTEQNPHIDSFLSVATSNSP